MKRKKIYIPIIALFLTGGLLFGGCRHHSHHDKADRMIRYLTDELTLNVDQTAMLDRFKDEMLKKKGEMRASREQHKSIFMEELRSETIDQDRLMNIYLEHKPIMDDMVSFVIASLAEFHDSLNEDQRSIVIEKLKSLEKWHSHFSD